MSAIDHSVLFKSKSARHFGKYINQNEKKEETHRNRHDKRHTAYIKNRIIPVTPGISPSSDKDTSKKSSTFSRQKAFREKFKLYLDKKANDQHTKAKLKPFLSAVPKGRFINTEEKRTEIKKKNANKESLTVPQYETPRLPTMYARSKKLTLTEKFRTTEQKDRKNKENFKSNEIKKRCKPVTLICQSSIKNEQSKPTASDAANIVKTTTTNHSKRTLMKPTKLNKEEQTKTAECNSLITSTVIRKKKLKQTLNKKMNVFNESISPIEETQDADLTNVSYISRFVFSNQQDSRKKELIIFNTTSNKNDNDMMATPETSTEQGVSGLSYVSPYVTISRGGRNSNRKEKEARNKKYTLESRKSLDLNNSIEQRQNKEAATYFRLQVQRETNHLNSLVAEWSSLSYSDDPSIPGEYKDLIIVAIGQTRLLITSKFHQFINLIKQCEENDGEKQVKPEDLEGFWSMVYLQVENCNQRFDRLKSLKTNGWNDPELVVSKEKKIRTENSMVSKKKTVKKRVNTALAEMLKEARAKYKESKENKVRDNHWNSNILVSENRSSPYRCKTPRKTNTWIVSLKNQSHTHNKTTAI